MAGRRSSSTFRPQSFLTQGSHSDRTSSTARNLPTLSPTRKHMNGEDFNVFFNGAHTPQPTQKTQPPQKPQYDQRIQGSESRNVTFAETHLTEGPHYSKKPPEQVGSLPTSMQTKPHTNQTSTDTSKTPESESDKARRIANEEAIKRATEATQKAQIASAVALGLATNNRGGRSQESAQELVKIAKQAVVEETKNKAMAKQEPEVEEKGLFSSLFSFFTPPPAPPAPPATPEKPLSSFSIFNKLTGLLTTESSQKKQPTSEAPPPTAEQNTVLGLFWSFTQNKEDERKNRAKQAQPTPEQTPTQPKKQLAEEQARNEFAEIKQKWEERQKTPKPQFLNASDPRSFLQFASKHHRTQTSSQNNSFTLWSWQPSEPQTSTSSKPKIDHEHKKLWESVFPEYANSSKYDRFLTDEGFRDDMWNKFHEIKKELTPHNMYSLKNTAKIANFTKLLEYEKHDTKEKKETVEKLKIHLKSLPTVVKSNYESSQAKKTAEEEAKEKAELKELWLATIGKYDNYGSLTPDKKQEKKEDKFQAFYTNRESAEAQLKTTCQALSDNLSLTHYEMSNVLKDLRSLMVKKGYSTEWINVLGGMEYKKQGFQGRPHLNMSQDAGRGIQNTQLQLSFEQELITQNGKHKVDLSDIRKELYGDRYKIGKGLKVDISPLGRVVRPKDPKEVQRDRIQAARDEVGDFSSEGGIVSKIGEGVAWHRAKAQIKAEDGLSSLTNSAHDFVGRIFSGGGGKSSGNGR